MTAPNATERIKSEFLFVDVDKKYFFKLEKVCRIDLK